MVRGRPTLLKEFAFLGIEAYSVVVVVHLLTICRRKIHIEVENFNILLAEGQPTPVALFPMMFFLEKKTDTHTQLSTEACLFFLLIFLGQHVK